MFPPMVAAILIPTLSVVLAAVAVRFAPEQRPGFSERRPERAGERWSVG